MHGVWNWPRRIMKKLEDSYGLSKSSSRATWRRFVYGRFANARKASSEDADESNPMPSTTDQNADIARICGVASTFAAASSIHFAFASGSSGSSLEFHSVT